MTPDVSADATQAARERLVEDADYLAAEDGFEVIEGGHRCAADIRTILAVLATAEAQRDALEEERAEEWRKRRDAEGSRDVSKAACDAMRRERDAALALAGERLEALESLLSEAEDVFNCMADATGIAWRNYPAPFRSAAALAASASESPPQQQHDQDHHDQP